jgi:hypothetical protein
MKTILFSCVLFFSSLYLYGQNPGARPLSGLAPIDISAGISLHFRSPEPISYVDISGNAVRGDLPLKNVLRIRVNADSAGKRKDEAHPVVVTIVGETFMAQYHLRCVEVTGAEGNTTDIEILPSDMVPLDPQRPRLSTPAMRVHAMDMLGIRKNRPIARTATSGISAQLNQIYAVGDLVFLDLSFENASPLPYDIEVLRFSLEDKKINKASNHQSVEIPLVWSLYPSQRFAKRFRNIYVTDKLSFSREKRLMITLSEKQLSARTLTLRLKYAAVLNADTF